MTEEELQAPAPEQAEPGGIASRKPVLLSAVVVLGLIGGVVGIFAAMPDDAGSGGDAGSAVTAYEWLGRPPPDAGALASETTGGYEAAALSEARDTASAAGHPGAPDGAPEDSQAEPAAPAGLGEDGVTVRSGVVKAGVPVIKSLTSLGIGTGDAQGLINALTGLFDFRHAQPGQKFEVRLASGTRTPVSFRYEESLTEVYIVTRDGEGYRARKAHIPTQKRALLLGGTIARSLASTLSDLEAHPALVGRIADVLSTQVNFFKEQRPGDTFRVMVEEESLDGEFLGYGPVLALEYRGVRSGVKRFFRYEPGDENPTYFDERGVSVPTSAILVPLHYTRMSSPFGYRFHPVLKQRKLHNGTDFAAPSGTPVWACAAGTVIIAGAKGANGNLVGLDHGDGLSSYYAHLSRFASGIKSGREVRQRQIIGYVGNTGRSTGPHLHWGLKKNGKFIDPLKYKIRPGKPVAPRYRNDLMSIIAERGRKLDQTRIQPAKGPLEQVPEAGSEVLGMEEDL
jgi:murein DD-endopeptidase MepM/ murein hydrolase activator NlpD